MPEEQNQLILRYLDDAIAAERSSQSQYRTFASDGDDEEVKALFAACAQRAEAAGNHLTTLLTAKEAHPSTAKTLAANALASMPRAAQLGHISEERTVQNLIAAYTLEKGLAGMYRSLAAAAQAAGHSAVAQVASESLDAADDLAGRLFHLIPTRSIIAYNMLTLTEVDPAVETKYRESSW